jgi:hypothetical protein
MVNEGGITMTKKDIRSILFFLGILAILPCYFLSSALVERIKLELRDTNAPETRAELCVLIDIDPTEEPLCESGYYWELLELAFPPGLATRKEVSTALASVFLETKISDEGNFIDFYEVQKGTVYAFLFDEEQKFEGVSYDEYYDLYRE